MDYKAFYDDVYGWIMQCNQMATQHGLANEIFWEWVMTSAGELSNKYNNEPLVKKQMIMLINWIEEIYNASIAVRSE